METGIAILLIFVTIYFGFIIMLGYGIGKVKVFATATALPQTTFSIVIPFRNEDQNLPYLLESLANMDYPTEKFELIFVDDFSEDFSVNVINKWRMNNGKIQTTVLENLRLTHSSKKDAISRAVPIIKNQWIVTTDADCILPRNWLNTLNSYILEKHPKMIAAPVFYGGDTSLLHHFQRLDMLSLQGATIGGFGISEAFMCNGANFAYTKKLFLELGGFTGNDAVASGDDVFLLQKAVAANSAAVHYLKAHEAIVKTNPTENWGALFQQRIRWAAKSTHYQNHFAKDLALVVFLGNLSACITMFAAVTAALAWKIALAILLIKWIPDVVLLYRSNQFLRNGRFFFPGFGLLIYPFFCVFVALYSVVGTYEWKGRKYAK